MPADAAACTRRERAYSKGSQDFSQRRSADMSTAPRMIESMRTDDFAISIACSRPWLVSMMTQKRIWRAGPEDSSVSISCTSSADRIFGIMIDGGGASDSMMAVRSFKPSGVDKPLMRTMRSTCGCVFALNSGNVSARPSSLRLRATASSMSMQTMSAPESSALT